MKNFILTISRALAAKKKLFILFVALIASVGTMFAVTIDGIEYYLNETELTAEVIRKSPYYTGEVVVPSSVNYNAKTYSVTSIGERAFSGCEGLTNVTIPNSVTSIGDYAFDGCTSLTSVTIPNSVTSIGDDAFYWCFSLTSVTIPNGVTSIGNGAFYSTGLISVTIPNSVTSIGNSAFSSCFGLNSIIVESGNTRYDSRNNCNAIIETAFNTLVVGCKNTIIPNSVTSIGNYAFYYCYSLTSVTIPNSVTSIGEGAFNRTGLISVTIPNSVTSIGDCAFSSCDGLNSIIVESGNTRYDSRNNCNAIIETAFNTLVVGCKNTIIPNSVTSIGDYAFYWCSSLTSVTIPNSVTSIGNYAFFDCTSLASVTIPNSVTSIGDYAFYWCSSLTSVTIPNSVTSIGNYAFFNCSGLISVTIPNSVTSIGDCAFDGCTSLTSIYNYATTPQIIDSSVFERWIQGVDKSTCILYVPAESIELYKAADVWKEFLHIEAIPLNEAIENTYSSSLQGENRGVLIYRDGQILIQKGNKTYTLTGTKVK